METIQASRNLIDLFKSYINGKEISETELNDLLVTIAIEIDNRKIKGDESELTAELEKLGMTGIDYEGSTLNPAGYGNDVVLQIHGRLEETYEIYEKRVSTAKN